MGPMARQTETDEQKYLREAADTVAWTNDTRWGA